MKKLREKKFKKTGLLLSGFLAGLAVSAMLVFSPLKMLNGIDRNASNSKSEMDRSARAFETGIELLKSGIRSSNAKEIRKAESFIHSAFVRDPLNADFLRKYSEILIRWVDEPDVDKNRLGSRLILAEDLVLEKLPYFEQEVTIQLCQNILVDIQDAQSRLGLLLEKEYDTKPNAEDDVFSGAPLEKEKETYTE